jgi:DNA topoisomerase-1
MGSSVELPRSVPPEVSAREAGLRYVSDKVPGISRVRVGEEFKYLDPQGKPVHDEPTLQRIRSLVIPPNWSDVWICPIAKGHLQATGRDAKRRKQYRYHTLYRTVREETKFEKMILFGELLPKIRQRIEHDLSLRGLPKEKVLATLVRIMDLAHVRVGNEEYARENQSYGLTTMRDKHVQIEGNTIHFRFKGKSGKLHDLELSDRRLASIVARCRDLPGYELFQYVDDDGQPVSVDSVMVNQYLREITGEDITAKDFRTWHGTVHAAVQLGSCGISTDSAAKHNIIAAIKIVAEKLGNRPATCRKYYIHPLIVETYVAGNLPQQMAVTEEAAARGELSAPERCVLEILRREQRLSNAVKGTSPKKAARRPNGSRAVGVTPAAS